MFSLTGYFVLGYLLLGAFFYIWGYPRIFSKSGRLAESRGYDNFASRHAAHAVQAVSFILNDIPRFTKVRRLSVRQIYERSVAQAFDLRHRFLTTGSPHSRALFLRNYAWFYPALLDVSTLASPEDAERRVTLIVRSLMVALESGKTIPYPTTLVPITRRRFAGVNYMHQPSDSLLGVFAGLAELVHADARGRPEYEGILARARMEGEALLAGHTASLQAQTRYLIDSLRGYASAQGTSVPLIDRDESRSSSTDTRVERRRFVANANVWATLHKAMRLGVISRQEIEESIGRSLETYRQDLLKLFGAPGYIVNSLETITGHPPHDVTLDFCHVHDGFWSFASPGEIDLFRTTADVFLSSPELRDRSEACFLVAAANPQLSFFKRIAAASYHGRTMWPAFNVRFADQLLDLAGVTGQDRYRAVAHQILKTIRARVETIGYYPEVLREDGLPYRTWIYRSAHADSWFPYFAYVWEKAFDEDLA